MRDPSRTLISHVFDSNALPQDERLDVWREGLLSTHQVLLDDNVVFHATGRIWRHDEFVLTGGEMTPQTLIRTSREIRRDQIDHYGLFTVGDGARVATINDGESVIRRGDLQVFDFSQPETSVSLGGRTTTLYLPRDLIDGLFPGFSRFHGTVLRDPRSRLLAQHLQSMHGYLGNLDEPAVSVLVDFTMSVAIDLLHEVLPLSSRPVHDPAIQRAEVVAHIRDQLTDPSLSVASLLLAFPLSRSSLFRLFEDDGGVERFIRQERLRAIRILLHSGTEQRPLEEIALAFGFGSGWALARSFRETFGYLPSSLRAVKPEHTAADHIPQSAVPAIHEVVRG
ncbi:MAG: helix-turn-helix domain-containing protein [Thermomicrobiales bacterium]